MKMVAITAGSGFGCRTAYYRIVGGQLALVFEGEDDNLAGNDLVVGFEGLTIDEARKKVAQIKADWAKSLEGHAWDGCHACDWAISLREMGQEDMRYLPDWLPERAVLSDEDYQELVRAIRAS